MLYSLDAGTCDSTFAIDFNIAINASITTCVECRIRGTLATIVQWLAPSGEQIMSGQNGVTIENGLLVINDAEIFITDLGMERIPFQLTCTSNLGDRSILVYRAGKLLVVNTLKM